MHNPHGYDDLPAAHAHGHTHGVFQQSRAGGQNTVDPVFSVLIALLIAYGAWRIVRQTVVIPMEGTPKEFQSGQVIAASRDIPGV